MFKRFWWVFPVMAAVGTMAWMVFPRVPPKTNATGAVSNRETFVDRPAARNSEIAGGETDPEVVRESSRHSAGEIERHQTEERRLSFLKAAIRELEDKVEEKRKVLAAIVRTKGIIYKGPDADYSGGADAPEDASKKALDAQDYVDAKREFETDQKLLEVMKLNLTNERAKVDPGGK